MMKLWISTLVLVLAAHSFCLAKEYEPPTLAAKVFAEYQPEVEARGVAEMVAAAAALKEVLSSDERAQCFLPAKSDERSKWTNVPPRGNEGGLRLGDLKEGPLEKVADFLATILSAQGYQKARTIMMADDLLLRPGTAEKRGGFGTANYWLLVFGEPSLEKPWGLQLDGHHVAYNVTIVGEKVTMSPSFIGTQPYLFKYKGEEIEPMAKEFALGFELMALLSEEQKAKAIVGDKRGRIKAGAGKDGLIPEAVGLCCGELNEAQTAILKALILTWVGDMPEKVVPARLKEISSELDKTYWSWSGPTEMGSDASYHLYGPSLIIEFAGQNLGGNPRDHLHSIYRNPKNEYGAAWVE